MRGLIPGHMSQTMKIASWNVNSIKARLDHVKAWLDSQKPDILLLQELKGLDFPYDVFDAMGYRCAAVPQKAYNGVAILSRHEIGLIHEKLPGMDHDEQARYIEADINNVRVIGIYAPNGNPVDSEKFPYKLTWLEHLKNRLAALRADRVPVVIGGDFNIIPDDHDCHDPQVWAGDALFRPESRRLYRAMLNLGYSDAFRVRTQNGGHYTFWDYQGGAWPANKGIRIDHFLLSPCIADRLQSCTIDKEPRGLEKASDHTPIIVTIAAPAKEG